MDPPKSFPILRLPFLAIEEIFKAMHPIEILIFSIISKRAKAVTKQMTFYSKYSIELCIDEKMGIEIRRTNNLILRLYLIASGKEVEENTVEGVGNSYNLRRIFKYSTDPVEEWKLLCIYVLEIFKKQTIGVLRMTMDAFVDQNVSIIDFLNTNVKSVDKCYLLQSEEENDVDEHTSYLLKNIKVNNELSSFLHIKNKNFDETMPKNLKQLFIQNAEWIGYDRLLEIDSRHVFLMNDRITNEEWNMFLKKWMTMETHLNLELLEFELKSFKDFRELVLDDIPHEVVDEGVKRTLITYRDKKMERSGGFDIKRIDGKTATCFVQYTGFEMIVH
ncbi:hypothetical protein GCK72_015445 [Caenorhabditis remanei]|uniref:F-box domain-containing protein n=1 Tax=Caenorhabditis remanei TaxID=31234 RepID=A0A6A5GWV5_CAERE|nr:hypothetical protein GCK72_015445 [Caenorhabditis remanei]KAF1758985.1 hypothetical protein GCK72_015445 [Caenorhabditis remanei]